VKNAAQKERRFSMPKTQRNRPAGRPRPRPYGNALGKNNNPPVGVGVLDDPL